MKRPSTSRDQLLTLSSLETLSVAVFFRLGGTTGGGGISGFMTLLLEDGTTFVEMFSFVAHLSVSV